ncbi:unnamed protein product [Orchesella dallaii]|uniref:Lipase domain-containing protein n=1 Tax=Orchesella dallaii TaxID=48710 RepID=A0ABP1QQY1_9HEXA
MSDFFIEVSSSSTTSSELNGTEATGGSRDGRCFLTLKKWFKLRAGEEEIISGNPDNVQFFLYPKPLDHNYKEEIKFKDTENLKKLSLRMGQQWKIVIHGFVTNSDYKSIQDIKNAYLARMVKTGEAQGSSYNIVLVNWDQLSTPRIGDDPNMLLYRLAVNNVPVVGRRVGEFIQFLMQNGVIRNMDELHVIGFSLGAHVAGEAGNTLKELIGQVPSRVTGLDPAGPAFYDVLKFAKRGLAKTDGRFVDVIHSNMGGMGTLSKLGHADFYPNGGGPIQKRCEEEYEQNKAKSKRQMGLPVSRLAALNSCSHNKAPEFFAMSILNPYMIACKCNTYMTFKTVCPCREKAVFGEHCDPRTEGSFYLDV